MFGKKKEEPKKPEVSYKDWEQDFGFLNLILSRKKGITKEYLINTYSLQKAERDYITDEELEPIISNIVTNVIDQTSASYREYLVKKYFGSEEALIAFITEDVYVDLTSDAINRNVVKIKNTLQKRMISSLNNLNKNGK